MLAEIILLCSVIAQLVTVFLALKLIRITGNRVSWLLISLSILGMAIRRCFSLYWFYAGDSLQQANQPYEVVGLITSLLMLFGVVLISPLFQSMARNIIDLKQAQETLQRGEKKLRDITSHLAEGIYVFDDRCLISFMNPEAERLLGWTMEEVKGKNVHDLIHYQKADGTPLPATECSMWKVLKTGKLFSSRDEVFIRKDGSIFPASVIASPIEENGKIVSSVTAFRDITEQRKLEQERETLIKKLQVSIENVNLLSGILPICMHCKGIRDDQGYWNKLEKFIADHSEAEFSHGICPDCMQKHYPEVHADLCARGKMGLDGIQNGKAEIKRDKN